MNRNELMRFRKKISVFVSAALAVVLSVSLCGCGSTGETSAETAPKEEHFAGMANPLHECAEGELVTVTGIGLEAPEGAKNVKYFYIDTGNNPISQVLFDLDGKSFCYRAQSTAVTSIEAFAEGADPAEELGEALSRCVNVGAALSGMHYDWKTAERTDVAGSRKAVMGYNDGKEGFISWLDVVPGVLYSLSVDQGASGACLTEMAELCFVPLQGDVG